MAERRLRNSPSRPRYYSLHSLDRHRKKYERPEPVLLDEGANDPRHRAVERWVSFALPDRKKKLNLRVCAGADARFALCEWLIRDYVEKTGPEDFDVGRIAHFMEEASLNAPLRWSEHGWRLFHHDREGIPELREAEEIWEAATERLGPPPTVLLGLLDPSFIQAACAHPDFERYQHLFPWHGQTAVLLSLDLSRDLDRQFRELRAECVAMKQFGLSLCAGVWDRPARRESVRDVLIFTMRETGKRSIEWIAKRFFPGQTLASAKGKVSARLQTTRRRIEEHRPEAMSKGEA